MISTNGGIAKSDQTAAEAGTSDSVWMSPLKTKQAITANTTGKNLVINGNFNSWQEGTSFAAIATNTFVADLYSYQKVGAMVHTISRETDVPTVAESGHFSNYSLLIDCTTADATVAATDLTYLAHRIEGYNFQKIAQKEFTVSFWHKHTKTGTYCVALKNSGDDRTYIAEYTQTTTDTWEKATITVAASPSAGTWDYTTGVGLSVNFTLVAGTTYQTTADAWQTGDFFGTSNQVNACDNVLNNFRIARVQVESGDTATDFESESIQQEIVLIDRYLRYARVRVTNNTDAEELRAAFDYHYEMRVNPTASITVDTGSGTTISSTSQTFGASNNGYVIQTTANSSATGATIFLDARL